MTAISFSRSGKPRAKSAAPNAYLQPAAPVWAEIRRNRKRGVADGRFHLPKELKVIRCSARKRFDVQVNPIGAGLNEAARMVCKRLALAKVIQVNVAVQEPTGPWDDPDFGAIHGYRRKIWPRVEDRSGQSPPWTASRASPRDPWGQEKGKCA